ncbi:MAG: prepilin-type N-terminal cleavage/methylation domain-containing protein [Candidatus Daviesbacteria bacterium]|nr:prepilin-type N-terminal cleavage/methylation domain-containing protein [Candidatus Daviesbacteria bacterium]
MRKSKGFTRTNFRNIKKNLRGFTLIELLVAISIVAVLATIGFTLFQGAQATARDGKRRADVQSMATALETHFDAVTGIYAPLVATWFSDKIVPVDPLNASGYVYSIVIPEGSATYVACAKLEKGGGNFTDAGTTPGSGDYYCKLNQQQ